MSYETPLKSVTSNLNRLVDTVTGVQKQSFAISQERQRSETQQSETLKRMQLKRQEQDLQEREDTAKGIISHRNKALLIEQRRKLAIDLGATIAGIDWTDKDSVTQGKTNIFGDDGIFSRHQASFDNSYTSIPEGNDAVALAWQEGLSSSRRNANDRVLKLEVEGSQRRLLKSVSDFQATLIASSVEAHKESKSVEDSYDRIVGDLTELDTEFEILTHKDKIGSVKDSQGNEVSIVSSPSLYEDAAIKAKAGHVEVAIRSLLSVGNETIALDLIQRLKDEGVDIINEEYAANENDPPQRLGTYLADLVKTQVEKNYESIPALRKSYDQAFSMIEMERHSLVGNYDDQSIQRAQELEQQQNELKESLRAEVDDRIDLAYRVGSIDEKRKTRDKMFTHWEATSALNGINFNDTASRNVASGNGSSGASNGNLQQVFKQLESSNPDYHPLLVLSMASDTARQQTGGYSVEDFGFITNMMRHYIKDDESTTHVQNWFETIRREISNPRFFTPGNPSRNSQLRAIAARSRTVDEFLQAFSDEEEAKASEGQIEFQSERLMTEDGLFASGESVSLTTAMGVMEWSKKTGNQVFGVPRSQLSDHNIWAPQQGQRITAGKRLFKFLRRTNPGLSDDVLLEKTEDRITYGPSLGMIVGQNKKIDGRLIESYVAALASAEGMEGFEFYEDMSPKELAKALERFEIVPFHNDWNNPSQIRYGLYYKRTGTQAFSKKSGSPLTFDLSELHQMKKDGILTLEDLQEHHAMGGQDFFEDADINTLMAVMPYDGKSPADDRWGAFFSAGFDSTSYVLGEALDTVLNMPVFTEAASMDPPQEFEHSFKQSEWESEGAPINPKTAAVLMKSGIDSDSVYKGFTNADMIYNPDPEFLESLRENGQGHLADAMLNERAFLHAWGAKGFPRSEDERTAHRLTTLITQLAYHEAGKSPNEIIDIPSTIQTEAVLADLAEQLPGLGEAAKEVDFSKYAEKHTSIIQDTAWFLGKAIEGVTGVAQDVYNAADSWQRGVRRNAAEDIETLGGMHALDVPPEWNPGPLVNREMAVEAWDAFWHPSEDEEDFQNGTDTRSLKPQKREFTFTDDQIRDVNAFLRGGQMISTNNMSTEENLDFLLGQVPEEGSSTWHINSGPERIKLDIGFLAKVAEEVSNGRSLDFNFQEMADIQTSKVSYVDDGDTFIIFNDESMVLSMRPPEELEHHYGEGVPEGVPVRLAYIDTTEIERPWLDKKGEMGSDEATFFAIKALNGKDVFIRPLLNSDGSTVRGYYGRPIVDIGIEGENPLAEQLVSHGLAFVRPSEQGTSFVHAERYRKMLSLQKRAESLGLGLFRLHTSDNTAIHQTLYWEMHNLAVATESYGVDESGNPVTLNLAVHTPYDSKDSYIIPTYNLATGEQYENAEQAWAQMGESLAEEGKIFPFANSALARKVMRGIIPRVETYQYKDHFIHQTLMSYHQNATLDDFDTRMEGLSEAVDHLSEKEAAFYMDKWKVINPHRPPNAQSFTKFMQRYE